MCTLLNVFLVGRTLCLLQYDRDVLLRIRDSLSECDMQLIYRFNDILLSSQNWVTDRLNDFYSRFDNNNTIPPSSVINLPPPPPPTSLLSQMTNLS